MEYKVTIAMPVYNTGREVERALRSALDQTFEPLELLIIDDRGTDDSMQIVRAFIDRHPRREHVRIIEHSTNLGTGATKNTAIDHARGEYLFFMDSDDTITSDCIARLYDQITRTPVDFVAAAYRKVSPDGAQTLFTWKFDQPITRHEPYALALYRRGTIRRLYIMTWNKLFNLDFLRQQHITCVPHHLNEDIWFSFQLNYKTSSFTLLPEVTYDWYVRAESTSNKVIIQGLSAAKAETFIDALGYQIEALRTDTKAQACPYLADDVMEFTLGLCEGVLRSSRIEQAQKRALIIRATDLGSDLSGKRPDLRANQFALYLFRRRNPLYRMLYLYVVRYGRGLLFAARRPLTMLRKKLHIGQ